MSIIFGGWSGSLVCMMLAMSLWCWPSATGSLHGREKCLRTSWDKLGILSANVKVIYTNIREIPALPGCLLYKINAILTSELIDSVWMSLGYIYILQRPINFHSVPRPFPLPEMSFPTPSHSNTSTNCVACSIAWRWALLTAHHCCVTLCHFVWAKALLRAACIGLINVSWLLTFVNREGSSSEMLRLLVNPIICESGRWSKSQQMALSLFLLPWCDACQWNTDVFLCTGKLKQALFWLLVAWF